MADRRNTRRPKGQSPAPPANVPERTPGIPARTVRLKIMANGPRFQKTMRLLREAQVTYVGSPPKMTGAAINLAVTEGLLSVAGELENLGNCWVSSPPDASMLGTPPKRCPRSA